ncbi:DUF2252 domain-containing protein [candidate division KSB1 bacterium]|nr:DUF2252 domain-containing protein [candidate division KSB1 bacterium]NIS27049.1 DUF2252 domain-containing protein [candidate division KSB1 bacterium]NIT73889.1 DUF2252 domain-containing protein [candidate division KSB1 bacterium]NIW21733.1 DUF2252 domain-containing protein [candidate division KSB1 bacterium]NIX73569.1 DUF2252 domain-containing protein [candidate division KSB1 bacterium]
MNETELNWAPELPKIGGGRRLRMQNRCAPPKYLLLKYLPILCTAFFLYQSSGVSAQNNHDDSPINPLYVDPAAHDFSQNPPLLDRIRSGPHGYLRFINIEFSKEVCRRFRDIIPQTPMFNLHGDAHLEQYAITDLGRGLTDFDDSSTGPAFLDLMRFGVSLHLTCLANKWGQHSDTLFDEFLSGYRSALQDPKIEAPEPKVVKRIRSKFRYNRESYFEWVDSIIDPIPPEEQAELSDALKPYIRTMIAEKPNLTQEFFNVRNMGYLRLGIGSALDLKYLVRLRGDTDEPLDDVVLEIKEVRNISGIDCIGKTHQSDPFRVLLGQARIAYQPFKLLGYLRMRGRAFWIHSWVDNYKEVDIHETFKSVDELREVVYDVGLQLGKGHPKQIAAPLDLQLRREQLRLLIKYEQVLKETRKELAQLAISAWEGFCLQVNKDEGK